MRVGDLVMVKEKPVKGEEHDIGIVVGFKPRNGITKYQDPDCDVRNDAIVMWPSFGIAYHMRALLKVISEDR